MSDIQHIGGRTPDLTEENVDKLVALFPDVLTEVTDQQTGKAESGDYDDDGGQLVVNPESNGRFHSDWCSMIYPRLLLARDLLASDGVIFISIDENESANLKKICDEVFGNECFVNKVIWRSSDNSNNDAKQFSNDYNDILIYSKKPGWQPNRLQDPEKRRHFKNPDNDPRGAWFDGDPLNSPNYRENLRYEIVAPNGNIIKAFRCLVWVSGSGGWWCWSGSLGVWIPRRCSPPPCNCLTRGGCRAWSSVTRRTADGNCISRSGSRRVRGSPARNRGAARPRVRCMTRGSACGGI